jgi:predicted Zn-dependent protease
MARWFWILVVLVVGAGFGLRAGDVEASSTLDLLGVAWAKSGVTVLINAGKGVSAQAINDVESAVGDWNDVLALVNGAPQFTLVSGVKSADIVIHMKVGGGSVLGHTLPKTVTPFSCGVKSASIQLSGRAFGTSFSSTGTRNVARHELGHALGLGHSDDPLDLMYAAAESSEVFGETNVPISVCDKNGLDAIYPLPTVCAIPDSVSCP